MKNKKKKLCLMTRKRITKRNCQIPNMTAMRRLSVFLIFISLSLAKASYLEYDGWLNIELFHALDIDNPDKFTFRGNITIPSLNQGVASPNQEPLNADERQKLKRLAEENEFYRLRAVAVYSDGTRSTYLTSSKACSLANSLLTDMLWVSLDSTGSVLGVTQSVTGSGICLKSQVLADDLENFSTDVFIKHMELAPTPDTTSFIQKLEREREARERGDVRDNRGFFAKYWMYIVPVAMLIIISSATNPEAGAGGGGGGR